MKKIEPSGAKTPRIYLLGGVDALGGQVSPLDHHWLADTHGKPLCVVDLTTNSTEKLAETRSTLAAHFSKMTASKLVFVSELSCREDVLEAFGEAGAIYIPGGDTEALLDNLHAQDFSSVLRRCTIPIVGNSAGALALCRDVILTTDANIKEPLVLAGLGLVSFSIDPHYDATHDEELFTLSEGRVIYGLPEESGIITEGHSVEFVGPVWKFADGRRERVN